MIPLSLILWLMMQGQSGADGCNPIPSSLCYYAGCENAPIEVVGGCPVYSTPIGETHPTPVSVPAEHVIEIRTQLEEYRACMETAIKRCDKFCDKLDLKTFPLKEVDQFIKCHTCEDRASVEGATCSQRVTREVWIDGTRWGVLKGLE